MPFTTVVAGTVITASWGNMVRDQLVTPFADAATRTAQRTVPVEGMLSWLSDVDRFEVYDGATDVPASYADMGEAEWTSSTGATTVETLVANSSVTFTAVTGRKYRVTASTMYSSNQAGDNVTVRLRSAAGATVTSAGTLRREIVAAAAAANATTPLTFVENISGLAAGQTTVGLLVVRYSGTGTVLVGNAVNSGNSLLVEDVGAA